MVTPREINRIKLGENRKNRMSKIRPTEPATKSAATTRRKPNNSRAVQAPINVHLVSELTGNLARQMVTTAMSQFPSVDYSLHEHPFCNTIESLRVARNAIDPEAVSLVFSALTQTRLKRSLIKWCERREIDHWELMQPLVDFVATQTGRREIRDTSRMHRCDQEYLRRIDAWEFTLRHDDSLGLETVGQADLILAGVSRVGKTPLAAYLGSLGYRVANISLVRNTAVPPEVKEHRERIVGLTIDAERLTNIRKRRFELNRFAKAYRDNSGRSHSYCSGKSALDDVLFAEQQFRRLGIPILDITTMTVEESGSRILNLLKIGQIR